MTATGGETGPARLELIALVGVPVVAQGDDLAALTLAALARSDLSLQERDVLVVAQKIVSKAEGRMVELHSVVPSERAVALGREVDKDPRLVELILSETKRIVRSGPDVLIVRASARLRQRQRRRRPVQRRPAGRHRAGAAAAARSGRERGATAGGAAEGARRGHRRHHQRQLRAPVAARYGRYGDRRGRPAGAQGPARPA